MPLNRPFIDAQGKRGKPRLRVDLNLPVNKPSHSLGSGIQFKSNDSKTLLVIYPGGKGIVSRKNAYKLAHWLFNECREEGLK